MPDVFVRSEESKDGGKKVSPSEGVLESDQTKKEESVHNKPNHSHNPLAAYSVQPDGVRFVNQDPDEKILLLLRKHPITNIRWILITLVLAISPIVLRYFPIFSFLPERFQFIAIISWYLIVLAFVFEEFLSWFFSVFIITDERIIDVDFLNLIYRKISDANIDQIQDVTVQVGGPVRALFDFGSIKIQTAGEVPEIEFEDVPHPDKVARLLRELRVEEEKEKLEGRVR